ncbi:hypothetical protein [Nostoc sp.]
MQRDGEFLQNAFRVVQAPVNHHSGGVGEMREMRKQGEIREKNQYTMPNAPCPMPNAQYPT